MTDIDRQYWKIKDFAEHFGATRSKPSPYGRP
jgi:hypothetical protein